MYDLKNMLVERYRPQTLDDIVLDDQTRKYFEQIKITKNIPHLLFCGTQGTGKTSLAKIIVKILDAQYRYINISDERGIDISREKISTFAQTKSFNGEFKVVILDEFDNGTPDLQRALRNTMEEYADNVRFILTGNYKNRIIKPIQSRCQIFELVPPIDGCYKRIIDILNSEKIKVSNEQKQKLVDLIQSNYPDIRYTINTIQKCTINNILNIKEIKDTIVFSGKIVQMIQKNSNVNDIRTFIIQNEIEFNNDYLSVLKGMYEYIYENIQEEDKKRDSMLTVGRFMESHQNVMDFEINTFCCIIQLLKIFNN